MLKGAGRRSESKQQTGSAAAGLALNGTPRWELRTVSTSTLCCGVFQSDVSEKPGSARTVCRQAVRL